MKYFIDFAALALLYARFFYRRWRREGLDVLLVNTLLYVYLSLVLYVTLMPVIASLPFLFNHPYSPMNLIPFVDVLAGRGDFLRQVLLNVIMTMPFGFLFPLAGNRKARFGRTVFFLFFDDSGYRAAAAAYQRHPLLGYHGHHHQYDRRDTGIRSLSGFQAGRVLDIGPSEKVGAAFAAAMIAAINS